MQLGQLKQVYDERGAKLCPASSRLVLCRLNLQGTTALEQALKQQRLHVLYADLLLWRDRTRNIVATVQQHQKDNVVVCDDT